jgi:glycosyltransferase involved in cell wall biosynthesis
MKILMTQEIFPPEVVGGGEMIFHKLAKKIIERGHEVKVVTSGDPNMKKYDGIETIRVPLNRYAMNLSLVPILNHAKDVDVIQTCSGNTALPSWAASKILSKPISCFVHHILGPYWRDVKGEVVGGLFEQMEKLFLNRDYDAIIFQNKSSQKIGLNIGIEKKRMFMIQPGIEHKKFQMKNVKKKPFVLFVGNFAMNESMVKTKGLNYLIEATKYLPEIKFFIVGGGDHLSELRRKSPRNVVFTGPLRGRQLVKLYNESLVYCLPSLAEGFGLTILEAMTTGCAIVSTIDIDQQGILIRTKNVSDIIEGIKKYINNPSLAIKSGKRNREIAKKFTWDKSINEFIRIYDLITR